VVSGLGGALLLASLLVGTTARLPYERRGQGTGAWTSAFFQGQFACPVLVAGLSAATGALTTALAVVGIAGLVVAVLVAALRRRIVPSAGESAAADDPIAAA
jgi:hypothetical protein